MKQSFYFGIQLLYNMYFRFGRRRLRQRKQDNELQSTYLTPQTGLGHRLQEDAYQTNPGENGLPTSSPLYANDNKAYVNITDTVTVPKYAGLEKANEYSNTAHIYSDLK